MIERAAKKVNITIQTARPGIVIGKKGEDIEKLRQETAKLLGMTVNDVRLNIAEIRKPELDAQLVADSIAQQIEKRVMFRRAMKRAVMSTMRSGALGVKVRVSGPLERRRDRAHRVVPRRPHSAAHLPRRHRLRPVRGAHHLRRHRRQGVDLQGRSVRQGAARARCRRAGSRSRRGCAGSGCRSCGRTAGARPASEIGCKERHAAAKAHQVPQTVQGPQHRPRPARQHRGLRRIRPEGDQPRAHDGARDRGRASRDGPLREARRPDLDPRVSRTCRSPRSRSKCAWAAARATSSTGLPR